MDQTGTELQTQGDRGSGDVAFYPWSFKGAQPKMKKQRVKEESETEGPSIPPSRRSPSRKKCPHANFHSLSVAFPPSAPLHSLAIPLQQPQHRRTNGRARRRRRGNMVRRPSVRLSARLSASDVPLPPSATAFRAAPLRWEKGRLACCPAAARKRGLSAAATATATTRSFFERKCPNSEVGGKEGWKEGNLARLHSLLIHSQSVTKLQGIEEQQ